MKKKVFYNEWAYVVGILTLALGTVFSEKAGFGMSMVVAPAYILHLKVSEYLPFFTFGMAEYTLQAALLIVMMLMVRRFRVGYLFSFVTAVIYGCVLDALMWALDGLPVDTIAIRIVWYVLGMVICAVGVSMFFHTYISPEAYELFVKETASRFNLNINKVKTVYDCCSCAVGVILSFCFFGLWEFKGVNIGTIVCALINGFLIGRCTALFEHIFEFKDGLKLRKVFDK